MTSQLSIVCQFCTGTVTYNKESPRKGEDSSSLAFACRRAMENHKYRCWLSKDQGSMQAARQLCLKRIEVLEGHQRALCGSAVAREFMFMGGRCSIGPRANMGSPQCPFEKAFSAEAESIESELGERKGDLLAVESAIDRSASSAPPIGEVRETQ